MDECWAAALEATALARALRNSVWAYPLVNAAHLLGMALLVGAIIPLDLRLMEAWSSAPIAPLWQVLTRTAGVGLLLAIVFGALLFITRATEYVASNFFIAKMMVVGVGIANALALRLVASDEVLRMHAPVEKLPVRLRIAGGVSLTAWLTALTLGRLIGYF